MPGTIEAAAERHRRLIIFRGRSAGSDARALVANRLHDADVLWVSPTEQSGDWHWTDPRGARKLLGRSFDAVVLDLRETLSADAIGQAHGFVWGGGALVLLLAEHATAKGDPRFAAYPYVATDVSARFAGRFDEALAGYQAPADAVLTAGHHATEGTAEQAALVDELSAWMVAPGDGVGVLTADRGRGKSSAVGLALGRLPAALSAVVTGPSADAVGEILRFAARAHGPPLEFVRALDLATGASEAPPSGHVIVVDEAAQLPVPLLRRLVERSAGVRLLFVTTVRGYEGTGRGFSLRFVPWVEAQPPHVQHFTLTAPIRWGAGDPLERLVLEALLLDAEPAAIRAEDVDAQAVTHRKLDRDALPPKTLRQFFGLLIFAHYRTTPDDLQRILDAPNIDLHALFDGDDNVIAATMVAHEGGLPEPLSHDVAAGRHRLRGHALTETLVSHLGLVDAGPLRMVRSVRIAVHPDLRRRGLGTKLINAIHAHYRPDLFGTLFGATAELLTFRRQAGYDVVRLGATRGARAGETAVAMMRPVSDAAHAVFAQARDALARDLPTQLRLFGADQELLLDAALAESLQAGLAPPTPWPASARAAIVSSYAYGPRTFEAAASALIEYVSDHRVALDRLPQPERTLIQARICDGAPWLETMERAGLASYPAVMRALRRAFRGLVEQVEASG